MHRIAQPRWTTQPSDERWSITAPIDSTARDDGYSANAYLAGSDPDAEAYARKYGRLGDDF